MGRRIPGSVQSVASVTRMNARDGVVAGAVGRVIARVAVGPVDVASAPHDPPAVAVATRRSNATPNRMLMATAGATAPPRATAEGRSAGAAFPHAATRLRGRRPAGPAKLRAQLCRRSPMPLPHGAHSFPPPGTAPQEEAPMYRLASLVVVVFVLVSAPPSSAAFPGANGRIALMRANQVYTVRADGTGLTKLTSTGRNARPSWSPDGTRIAFQR